MNNAISRRLHLFLVSVVSVGALNLAGCATMQPLHSTPPVPKFVLNSSYDARSFQGLLPPTPFHVILPPGEYHPVFEDDQAYYYQAPTKVVVNDLTSLLYDGGIYVKRGTAAPTGWYYIGEDGSQQFGSFSKPLPLR